MPARTRVLVALLTAALVWPTPGRAGTCDPLKTARALERRLDCRVHPTDPKCITTTEAAFGTAAACLLPSDTARLPILWFYVDGLALNLGWGSGPATSCATIRVRAAARYARVLVRARAGRVGVQAVARSLATLTKRLAKAVTAADCHTGFTVATADGWITALADRVTGLIQPTCGDGVQAGTEQCDGVEHTGCLTSCEAGCLCDAPAPVCGNGIIEPRLDPISNLGEQCDGQPICDAMCHLPQPTACCEFGDASGAVCLTLTPPLGELMLMCGQSGGHASYGSCMPDGGPCPPTLPPEYCQPPGIVGHCGVVPVPPTTLCCAGQNGCSQALVQDSGAVSEFIYGCWTDQAIPLVGTCDLTGACVPAN